MIYVLTNILNLTQMHKLAMISSSPTTPLSLPHDYPTACLTALDAERLSKSRLDKEILRLPCSSQKDSHRHQAVDYI